jgi:hypothetical protein
MTADGMPQSVAADTAYERLFAETNTRIALDMPPEAYLAALIPPPTAMREYAQRPRRRRMGC